MFGFSKKLFSMKKINKFIIATVFFTFWLVLECKAQTFPEIEWTRTFEGTTGYSLAETSEGGYVILGSKTKIVGSWTGYDIWLVKINSNNETEWEKTFSIKNFRDVGYSLCKTSDEGYVITGVTTDYLSGNEDVFLLKLNENGEKEWEKVFDKGVIDRGYAVIQTAGGGYMIAGETKNGGNDPADIWVIKTDSKGEKEWEKTFDIKDFDEIYSTTTNSDIAYSLIQTFEGGYLITGETRPSYGNYVKDPNLWLIKIKKDSAGEVEWNKILNGGIGYSANQTFDGGYIITGQKWNLSDRDLWLIKINSNGKVEWEKTFNYSSYDSGYQVIQTYDQGYILGGIGGSYYSPYLWIIKTNKEGKIDWEYISTSTLKDTRVIQTLNGGYLTLGNKSSPISSIIIKFQEKIDSFNLKEKFLKSSTLNETIVKENIKANEIEVRKDLTGTLNFDLEGIKIDSGLYKGKGFFKGKWNATLESLPYQGEWTGMFYFVEKTRKIYLKGKISGDLEGLGEGIFSESTLNNGIFDLYQGVWKLNKAKGKIISGVLLQNGKINWENRIEYPSTTIYFLQLLTEGEGYLSESKSAISLNNVLTHLRISDQNNPYNGEGFSLISYESNLGKGEIFTYDQIDALGKLHLFGMANGFLEGTVNGILSENKDTKQFLLLIEKINLGAPIVADLKVKTWGPSRVTPGATIDYIIEYRNDGLVPAENVVVVTKFPWQVSYISSTKNGIYRPEKHEVFWKLGTLPPQSKGNLTVKVKIEWGLPLNESFQVLTLIGSTSKTARESLFDIKEYLNYQPLTEISSYFLTNEELRNEFLKNERLKKLYDYALEKGFEYSGIANKKILSDNSEILRLLMVNSTSQEFLFLTKKDENVFLEQYSKDKIIFFDENGGIAYDPKKDSIEAWGELASSTQENATPTIPLCIRNCLLMELALGVLSKLITTIDTIFTTLDCLSCLTDPDPSACGKCANLALEISGLSEVLSIVKCITDCKDDPSSYACEACKEDKKWCSKIGLPGVLTFEAAVTKHCIFPGIWEPIGQYIPCTGCLEVLGECNACINGECKCIPCEEIHSSIVGSVARDPNVKYGPERNVLPGQSLTYRIEFENEGEGTAFGVYFSDVLDENLDDSTLEIGPVIDSETQEQIAPPGIYNKKTRTIIWFVGELGPKKGGYAEIKIKVKENVPTGTEIVNFATVYFPSVPEVTLTNAIINIVGSEVKQPPVPYINSPIFAYEGERVIFDGSNSFDPDGEIVLFEWDLNGDGFYEIETTSSKIYYTFGDNYQKEIRLKITDNDGLSSITTTQITILNSDPILSSINIENLSRSFPEIWVGDILKISATFTDPGWLDTHQVILNFGNGEKILIENLKGEVVQSYIYYQAGDYKITLSLLDDDGGTQTQTLEIKVKPIPATINCFPEILSLNTSKKWLTCYIELPLEYSVWKIDGSQIFLNGKYPIYLGKEKWATAESNKFNVRDYDRDGILERMVKFKISEIKEILTKEKINLKISGKVSHNSGFIDFEGETSIIVITFLSSFHFNFVLHEKINCYLSELGELYHCF